MSDPKLTQKQCEAVADILVLAMCADGHFSLLEEEKIQAKICGMDWDPDLSPSTYINLSIARARDVMDSTEKTKAYMETRAQILGNSELRDLTLKKTVELINVDGMNLDECVFIAQLRAIFQV